MSNQIKVEAPDCQIDYDNETGGWQVIWVDPQNPERMSGLFKTPTISEALAFVEAIALEYLPVSIREAPAKAPDPEIIVP